VCGTGKIDRHGWERWVSFIVDERLAGRHRRHRDGWVSRRLCCLLDSLPRWPV